MNRFVEIFQGLALPSAIDIPRLTGWINALLVLLLAYSMAVLTWQLLATPQMQDASASRIQPTGMATQKGGPGLDTVAAMHLLGEAGNVPVDETPIVAPETRLKFTLKGVFANSRSESAMAIISSGGNDEKSYRVGDVVAGAATLHQILADRVLLRRGEQLETLYLPKESSGGTGSGFSPAIRHTRSGGSTLPLSKGITNRKNLGGLREKLMANPQQALQLINAQPVMDNGQLAGFRVNPGKDRVLFSRVGLRPGDIVTAVNGMRLTDATQMGEVFQHLRSAERLEVTVKRGGREQHLQLKLD